mmetsp:Transcript_22258/g.40994  ORF Transcript_22258/g.40994 Transcript_22258/m.40994 type:complete len:201 (+) Transcript_22258:355-957(+)
MTYPGKAKPASTNLASRGRTSNTRLSAAAQRFRRSWLPLSKTPVSFTSSSAAGGTSIKTALTFSDCRIRWMLVGRRSRFLLNTHAMKSVCKPSTTSATCALQRGIRTCIRRPQLGAQSTKPPASSGRHRSESCFLSKPSETMVDIVVHAIPTMIHTTYGWKVAIDQAAQHAPAVKNAQPDSFRGKAAIFSTTCSAWRHSN